jgi:hypothetical protein
MVGFCCARDTALAATVVSTQLTHILTANSEDGDVTSSQLRDCCEEALRITRSEYNSRPPFIKLPKQQKASKARAKKKGGGTGADSPAAPPGYVLSACGPCGRGFYLKGQLQSYAPLQEEHGTMQWLYEWDAQNKTRKLPTGRVTVWASEADRIMLVDYYAPAKAGKSKPGQTMTRYYGKWRTTKFLTECAFHCAGPLPAGAPPDAVPQELKPVHLEELELDVCEKGGKLASFDFASLELKQGGLVALASRALPLHLAGRGLELLPAEQLAAKADGAAAMGPHARLAMSMRGQINCEDPDDADY